LTGLIFPYFLFYVFRKPRRRKPKIYLPNFSEKEEGDLRELQAIVQCIEELTIMTDVCKFLEQSEYGPAFFRNIMNFLVNATKNSERISTAIPQGERKYFHGDVINNVANEVVPRIRSSFINLTRRFFLILNYFLKNIFSIKMFNFWW